jgi:hypothetical protein
MTDGGRIGALGRIGAATDSACAARSVLARPPRELSDAATDDRAHMSTAAIGRQALAAYASVVAGRCEARA